VIMELPLVGQQLRTLPLELNIRVRLLAATEGTALTRSFQHK